MREGLCVLQVLIFEGVEADVEFRGAGQNADGFALGGVEEAKGGFKKGLLDFFQFCVCGFGVDANLGAVIEDGASEGQEQASGNHGMEAAGVGNGTEDEVGAGRGFFLDGGSVVGEGGAAAARVEGFTERDAEVFESVDEFDGSIVEGKRGEGKGWRHVETHCFGFGGAEAEAGLVGERNT